MLSKYKERIFLIILHISRQFYIIYDCFLKIKIRRKDRHCNNSNSSSSSSSSNSVYSKVFLYNSKISTFSGS